MKKDYVHTMNNYDYEERVGAMWEGYQVEFSLHEFKVIGTTKELHLIRETPNGVIVQYRQTKSDWEDLFQ